MCDDPDWDVEGKRFAFWVVAGLGDLWVGGVGGNGMDCIDFDGWVMMEQGHCGTALCYLMVWCGA